MAQILNQYSFLISALFLLAFLGGVMLISPTFIFFGAQGQETWRSVGQLDPPRVRDSLAGVP